MVYLGRRADDGGSHGACRAGRHPHHGSSRGGAESGRRGRTHGASFPAVATQAGGSTTRTTAPTSSTTGTPTMTRSASTPVFPGASPDTWAGQVHWNPPASMSQPPAEGVSASVFLDAPAPDRTGAAFLRPGTPNTDWARQPAGLTNEELRRNLARMEAESAAASGAQTPAVEIEIDADGRRRRVPPRGATTRPSRPTSPPRSRPTEQQSYTPMSMAASTQATDEVLNDAAIRLAMSNQNNAGVDVEMVDTSGQQTPVQPARRSIFPPIVADNAANRGRAHRRHGERPATADDPAPPAPIPDMAPLEARPVPWTPAQPVASPLSSVPSTPGLFPPVPPLTPVSQSRAPSPCTSAGGDYNDGTDDKDYHSEAPFPGHQGPLPHAARCIPIAGTHPPVWDGRAAVDQRRDRRNPAEPPRGLPPIQRSHACSGGGRRRCSAAVCTPPGQADDRGGDLDGRGRRCWRRCFSAQGPAVGCADLRRLLVLPTPA